MADVSIGSGLYLCRALGVCCAVGWLFYLRGAEVTKPRCLAIALFYNDDDIVADHLEHMLNNNHDVVVWDHGSNDRTPDVLDKFRGAIRGLYFMPRSFDFYKIFAHVSRYVMEHYAKDYDWISFPESDEFLEGPDRTKSYYDHVCDVVDSPYDWLEFRNQVFWYTSADDASIVSPRARIKHYSLWPDCPPRVYAWRARAMNERVFNHNPALGVKHPTLFTTCHYQFRSEAQAQKRIEGRMGLRRGVSNYHFDYMALNRELLRIDPSRLHYDDGGELSLTPSINWPDVYGSYRGLMEKIGEVV